jgi:alkylmercury lyase
MQTATPTVAQLATELVRASPKLDPTQQRVALMLYRLLADGRPVPAQRLADQASLALSEVRSLLAEWPGTFLDDDGAVIGFWGMALSGMPHVMRFDGHAIQAWCAWDTLFLPALIGKTVKVESRCISTGAAIALTVKATGTRDLSPPGVALSFQHPRAESFGANTIQSFCHFVHFFASEETANEWTARQAGTFVLSPDDGFELGRRVNHARFGARLTVDGDTPSDTW